jgi:D-alanyl-D-alanine carboxypeptidase (penicillin-binding protein 5/6)
MGAMQEPPYPRQTTTPRRRQRRSGGHSPLAIIGLVIVAVVALAVWQGLSAADDNDPNAAAPECPNDDCRTLAEDASIGAASPAPPTPCPYCNQDPERWRAFTSVQPPELGGKSAAVIENACGSLLYGLNQNDRRPPASLTKMVAAMVTLERARPADMVDIKVEGWELVAEDGSTIMGLEAGMRLSVQDLVYGMLLVSGNDAALALADHLGGTATFVGWMNDKVRALGFTNTHFVTPDGRYHPDHYSTALDMALVGRHLLSDPALRQVVATQQYQPQWDRPFIWNGNAMLYYYEGAIGVKTGYVEEGDFTIVTAAERNGRLLIVSVFGGWHLYLDAINLLDWAFDNTQSACAPAAP